MRISGLISVITVSIFILCFSFLLATKINLAAVDLGRYLENGAVLLHGTAAEKSALLHTNFYSYTNTTFPFINHHWGTSIIFYGIWKLGGFDGLSLFYIFCGIAAFLVSFGLAKKEGSLLNASFSALFFMPILVSRREVRPEMFTYLLSLIFFGILWLYKRGGLKQKWVWLLIPLQLMWVNIHIGFFFGEVIIGLFFLQSLFEKDRNRKEILFLGMLGVGSFIATLINPNGIRNAFYPLFIFRNFGYTLFENQSIPFLEAYGFHSFEFVTLKIGLFAGAVLLIVYIFQSKNWRFLVNPLVVMSAMVGILGYFQTRHMIMFGFFGMPLFSFLIAQVFTIKLGEKVRYVAITLLLFILVVSTYSNIKQRGIVQGIGLLPGMENAAQFYRTNHLAGPIFNNYDIGGYLIYELQNKEKVFVDNRPEAYPASFFQNIYIPSQTDDAIWSKINDEYHFNTIWFYRNDLTPWGQTMLQKRVQDPLWALIYVDDFSVIFVKRIPENQQLIQQYEIKTS